jgi:hypothetical protein
MANAEAANPSAQTAIALWDHPQWGRCELAYVEGADWIVRVLSTGRLHRFPPGTRSKFERVPGSTTHQTTVPRAAQPFPPSKGVAPIALATVTHPVRGEGDLLRLEVTDWIVRFRSDGKTYRYPPGARARLTVVRDHTPERSFTRPPDNTPRHPGVGPGRNGARTGNPDAIPPTKSERPGTARPRSNPRDASSARPTPASPTGERQRALLMIESLRNGLPPAVGGASQLAVGFDRITQHIGNLLHDVAGEGGRATVIKGTYGQGKSFAMRLLEEAALEANFVVVRTEIDATENRLSQPHHIYRDLLSHLRVPQTETRGKSAAAFLVQRAVQEVRDATRDLTHPDEWSDAAHLILQKEIGCKPLAWLLSDPDVATKPELVGLLTCDPSVTVAAARSRHRNGGGTRDWPAFNAGTQGDFASYLLSGLGRLCRYAGYRGLIIVMDEMEKWQNMNWKEQSQAGNLLGGLVWGATAEVGKRSRAHEPAAITHSLRGGGFPFTTPARNHVGVAIATTPRGAEGPEELWKEYGLLEIAYLPEMTDRLLSGYCGKIASHYAAAYGLTPPANGQLAPIAKQAVAAWKRRGELTTRSGVQAAITAFDAWRDRVVPG